MERHRFVRGVNGRPTPWNGLKCPPLLPPDNSTTTPRFEATLFHPLSCRRYSSLPPFLQCLLVSSIRPFVRILPHLFFFFFFSTPCITSSPYIHISSHYSRYTLLHTLSHHRPPSLRVLPPNPGYGSKSARPAPDDPSRYRY